MKNMIITIGMIIFIMTMTGMQYRCNSVLHRKQDMKFAADEAAATAALCIDREAFGQGIIKIRRAEAERAARDMAWLNLGKESGKLGIRFTEGVRPTVTVIITEGKLRAESEYEYVPY